MKGLTMNTLGARLRAALAGPPKKSQAALARACGVKPPSVHDWLSGETKTIEGQNLLRAAKFLGVSPEWLTTGKGPKHPGDVAAIEQAPTLTPKQQAWLGLFDGLTARQQEEEIRRLQAQKQQNDELLNELLKRRAG